MSASDNDQEHTHHAIDYIEISAKDVAAAKRFYGDAFGWKFNDYGPGYAGIQGVGRSAEIGGLCEAKEIKQGSGTPLVVLFSNDLDATVASVKKAGGTIVKEPFEFPGGRRFHFADPSGNELACWGHKKQ